MLSHRAARRCQSRFSLSPASAFVSQLCRAFPCERLQLYGFLALFARLAPSRRRRLVGFGAAIRLGGRAVASRAVYALGCARIATRPRQRRASARKPASQPATRFRPAGRLATGAQPNQPPTAQARPLRRRNQRAPALGEPAPASLRKEPAAMQQGVVDWHSQPCRPLELAGPTHARPAGWRRSQTAPARITLATGSRLSAPRVCAGLRASQMRMSKLVPVADNANREISIQSRARLARDSPHADKSVELAAGTSPGWPECAMLSFRGIVISTRAHTCLFAQLTAGRQAELSTDSRTARRELMRSRVRKSAPDRRRFAEPNPLPAPPAPRLGRRWHEPARLHHARALSRRRFVGPRAVWPSLLPSSGFPRSLIRSARRRTRRSAEPTRLIKRGARATCCAGAVVAAGSTVRS